MKLLLSMFLLLILNSTLAQDLPPDPTHSVSATQQVAKVINDPVFTFLKPLPAPSGPPMPPGAAAMKPVKTHEVLVAPKFKYTPGLKTVSAPEQRSIQQRKDAIADMIVTNGPIPMSEAAKRYYMPWAWGNYLKRHPDTRPR